jgi:hypothetical protein
LSEDAQVLDYAIFLPDLPFLFVFLQAYVPIKLVGDAKGFDDEGILLLLWEVASLPGGFQGAVVDISPGADERHFVLDPVVPGPHEQRQAAQAAGVAG